MNRRLEQCEADKQNMAAQIESLQSHSTRLEEEFVEERRVNAESMNRLTIEMTTKASDTALEEVHDRVDEIVEYVQEAQQRWDTLSRIPETEVDTLPAGSGKLLISSCTSMC